LEDSRVWFFNPRVSINDPRVVIGDPRVVFFEVAREMR
jgi:hypothetical protein